jgi:NADH:ubiquinone oxidoreductase subunit H
MAATAVTSALTAKVCAKVVVLFAALILVRITVPRMRFESLSKSGWVTGMALLAAILLVYVPAYLFT